MLEVQCGTASLHLQFCLYIDAWLGCFSRELPDLTFMAHTFLEQDAFEQRVLVTKHETLVRCRAMALLQSRQLLLILLDGRFQLLDVLSPTLSERRLRLSIALFALL